MKRLMNEQASRFKQLAGIRESEEPMTEANVPENVKAFAKRKGITSLVNKVAAWAEKSGKRIRGGTAIGKNYGTLILDLSYQDGAIRIDIDDESVELYDEPIGSAADFARVLKDMEAEQGAEEVNEAMEGKLEIDDRVKVTYGNEFYGETGTVVDIKRGFVVVEMDKDGNDYSMHISDVEKIDDEDDEDEYDEYYSGDYGEDVYEASGKYAGNDPHDKEIELPGIDDRPGYDVFGGYQGQRIKNSIVNLITNGTSEGDLIHYVREVIKAAKNLK